MTATQQRPPARDRLDDHDLIAYIVVADAPADSGDPVALHTEEPLPS